MAIGTVQLGQQQLLSLPYLLQQLQSSDAPTIFGQGAAKNNAIGNAVVKNAEVKPPEVNNEQKEKSQAQKAQIDASAVKLDLTLNFSAENLKNTLNNLLQKPNQALVQDEKKDQSKAEKDSADAAPFLSVGLSVSAERVQKTPTGTGSGSAQDLRVQSSKTTVSRENATYITQQAKLQIQRRQYQQINAGLHIINRNGYRIVRQKIQQRYHEDLSIKAELLDKFSSVTQKVAVKQPQSVEKFLDTTGKLVEDKNVSGQTISKFFDVVDSYVDKTKKALHEQIDRFMEGISKDYNVSADRLSEMGLGLHQKVDQFFNGVDKVLVALKDEALKSLTTSPSEASVTTSNEKMAPPTPSV